jgi:hypothetical protein
MPVSKGRKKKTKLKGSQSSFSKSFEQDGIKISQKGAMTYMENKRTEKQQEEFVNRVKENRPGFYEDIKQKITDVIEEIDKFDKITLLGIMCAYHIEKQYEDDGQGEVTLEYAQSICLASENKNSAILPTFDDGNRIIQKLIEIRRSFSIYYTTEQLAGKNSELENNIRRPIILESLFVRGDGYMQHVTQVFKELFSPHDEFLIKHYGFSANDINETFLQLEDSLCGRILYRNKKPHPAGERRFNIWRNNNSQESVEARGLSTMEAFGLDNPDVFIEDGKVKVFYIHDRTTYRQLFAIRPRYPVHQKVVEALAMPFGGNECFFNPSFKAEPLNDSLIFTSPIISEDGKYYLFGVNLGVRNLLRIGEYLIEKADKAYYKSHYLGNKYADTRDSYLENKTEKLFKAFLPDVEFFPGVKYTFDNDGTTINCNKSNEALGKVETELDLLGVGSEAVYLIEIKAGALNDMARRGALKSLTNTLKDVVGYAACQSFRARKHIEDNDLPAFYTKKKKEILIDKNKKVYRISVSLDYLGGLVTNLYDLKELNIIDKNVDFAWTVGLYDLMIFSEIIANEKDFRDYLDERLDLYKRSNIRIPDEISLLGFFLHEGNIKFDRPEIRRLDSFTINKNYSDDIDTYFHWRLMGMPAIPPFRKK